VLVGGGHANVQVLKILATSLSASERVRITLLSDYDRAFYSGMIPGCVAGLYSVGKSKK